MHALFTPAHKAYSHAMHRLGGGGNGHKLVVVPQPKSMVEFSPNFQDMLTPIGSRTD